MIKIDSMVLKDNFTKITFITLFTILFLYIINFVTDKNEALANVENKQIVEVFKSPVSYTHLTLPTNYSV